MSGVGAARDRAQRGTLHRQYLARDLRRMADPGLEHAGLVYDAAMGSGVHPEDARALLAEISQRLDPERVRP